MTLEPCARCKERNFVPTQISGFWLTTPLGGGGMGSVYKALHADFPNEVFAVKILQGDNVTDAAVIAVIANASNPNNEEYRPPPSHR